VIGPEKPDTKSGTGGCRRSPPSGSARLRKNVWEAAILMQQSDDGTHWKRTTRLMFVHLGIWLFFGYIIHMFVRPLNQIIIPVLNFPLGFYMAAQGSLIAFVVMLFVFAKQQDKIDREHGVAEDD
jgi:putative solute:sodium symporter small subunit